MAHPERRAAYGSLNTKALTAAHDAAQMMLDGSRRYEEIKRLVADYCDYTYAADIVSGQTETDMGGFDLLETDRNNGFRLASNGTYGSGD